MGYNTDFKGRLEIVHPLTEEQITHLDTILDEDCRDHPEWETDGLYYVDLVLSSNAKYLEWNGAEKTYDLDQLVNVVITQMRKKWPEFSLSGEMFAQGENFDDRWILRIEEDGFAHKIRIKFAGKTTTCPHCGEKFSTEEE